MADSSYANAISSIESGGNYGILGPVTKGGDRAYGKYQVMGSNVPGWTKEVLGAPMSPQDFLANPQAQDAVFNGKFGKYVQQYGPEGAAQAWFAGPGGVGKLDRKDSLGTSVGAYGQKFMAALNGPGGQNNPPAPVSGPQIPQQQASLPPQTMPSQSNGPIGGIFQPQPSPLPQTQFAQLQQPPPLQAPDASPLRNYIAQLAFNKIPTPANFRGFSLYRG